ncbi:MAG: FG-GAP-like repeat-containing protein [Lentisphaeraceae bacterium]|nr:FG-GAP-like repeat-containing protein [Lentisphaeraceae bacterium]
MSIRLMCYSILLFVCSAHAEKEYFEHKWSKTQLSDKFFAEGATSGDLNKDGHQDIVAGPYCYLGPNFKEKFEIYPAKEFKVKGYSDNFVASCFDIDKDGWQDVLVIGFPGKAVRWYKNPAKTGKPWLQFIALSSLDNESPMFVDVTGDGVPEIVGGHKGEYGYAEISKTDVAKPWTFQTVTKNARVHKFTHGMGIGDIDGDGLKDFIVSKGWYKNSGKVSEAWTFQKANFGVHHGAQMYAYDVDGDGDSDIISSKSAHSYGLVWAEQLEDKTFKPHLIMGENERDTPFGLAISQLHAIELVDMDGDGLKDIVTGKRWYAHNGKDPGAKEPAALYWFQLIREKGGVKYIPQPIDNDSGIGVSFTVKDLNEDGALDVMTSSKKGTFVHIHAKKKIDRRKWFWANHPSMKAIGKTPQQTSDGMTLPKGFKSTLFAGEPDVTQPIAFTIDDRGRLWVLENYSYPKWSAKGKDRIVIFEDTNGDGKHDKRKVFYDKINFGSGLEVGFGGVYVGTPPNLLFIPDKNGDDVPDSEPEVLLDGWAHQDTHETLNSFIWGPDGWLYGCHGVFTRSNVGKPGAADKDRQQINGGIWRFHPLKKEFEVFAHGTSNPWGVDFNDQGQAFLTCCVIEHLFHVVHHGRFKRQAGRHFNKYTYEDIQTIADHRHKAQKGMRAWNSKEATKEANKAGGGHAHAGAMIYLGDNWPDKYRNSIFMNNIHGNRINNDLLEPEGSGYHGTHGDDFMMANDKWYRGLYLRYGPDGGVFVNDWYDRRACHQQTPNDITNGRIYKITYGDVKSPQVNLSKLSSEELVQLQLHKNDWYVRTARRILMERGSNEKVHASLLTIFRENKDNTRKLRALWALHVTEGISEELFQEIFRHENEYVRAWGVQFAAESGRFSEKQLRTLETLAVQDKSAVVRLYLASALQRIPADQCWNIASALATKAEDNDDHNIPLMVWYGLEPLVDVDPAKALLMIDQIKIPKVKAFLLRKSAETSQGLVELVNVLKNTKSTQLEEEIVFAMSRAFEKKTKVAAPATWSAAYKKTISHPNNRVKDTLVALSVKFGDKTVFPELRQIVQSESSPLSRKSWALDTLVASKDKGSVEAYKTAFQNESLRSQAIQGLADSKAEDLSSLLMSKFKEMNQDEQQQSLSVLVSSESNALELLKAIDSKTVSKNILTAYHIRQLGSFKSKNLVELIKKNLGTVRSSSADLKKEMTKWRTLLNNNYMATADASNGRQVYQRSCAACHELFGKGGHVGPELTASNRKDLDYILQNVVDPNSVIGRDYQLNVLKLKDGRILSGMIKEENDQTLTLQMPGSKTLVVKENIKSRQVLESSMMPAGLFQTIQDSEVRDLVAYLQSDYQVPLPGEKPSFDSKTKKLIGAIEAEDLKNVKVAGQGKLQKQKMSGFKGRWSGENHLWLTGASKGTKVIVPLVKSVGKYEVFVSLTKARDYAQVDVLLGDKKVKSLDLYEPARSDRSDVTSTGMLSLGVHSLSSNSSLVFEITGHNPSAEKRFMFGLDCIKLVKKD